MTPKGERVLLSIIAAASVVMAAALVKREFFPRAVEPAPVERPVSVTGWEDVLPSSVQDGPVAAPLTVVVLSDLECPFCARWDVVLRQFVDAHRADVRVAFAHWPLDIHPHALPAARAAECAVPSGKFFDFAHAVYAKRDSLGKKSWGSYARDAGIRDTAAIARCAADERPVARIEAGTAFARRIGATGTPTVLLNGWKLPNPPTLPMLESALAAAKRGEPLFDGK